MALEGDPHFEEQLEQNAASVNAAKPQAPALSLQVVPARYTKTLHLVRHGQGYHNVAGHASVKNYLDPAYEDAHLTEFGWKQAFALREHIANLPHRLRIDVVLVSPLMRALETAVGAFGGAEWHDEADGAPLMLPQTGTPEVRWQQTGVSSSGCPPFVAWEGCREHLGLHPCDKRRDISFYQKRFPAVSFNLIETDADVLWRPDVRESNEALKARGLEFMRWLAQRPEQHIAVVSHSSFLFFALANFGQGAAEPIQKEIHRWYNNCEMRTVVLADLAGPGNLDPLHFLGGEMNGF